MAGGQPVIPDMSGSRGTAVTVLLSVLQTACRFRRLRARDALRGNVEDTKIILQPGSAQDDGTYEGKKTARKDFPGCLPFSTVFL